jgi:tetratricopeptide (TPR) repeat protein
MSGPALMIRLERSFMKRTPRIVSTAALCLLAAAAHAQHDHASPPAAALSESSIGKVDFETSCKPAVKDTFNRALSLLHSFWFPEARATFEAVLGTDPSCAIAHWGIALTHWGNPFAGLRSAQTIALGHTAAQKARTTGKPTPRERGYIEAGAILFSDANPRTQQERELRYETAMREVASAYPQDVEAQIFSALATAQSARPDDKTYARQMKAGALLEPLFQKMPHHPGVAHYLIHAYDVPALAAKALPAARAYADIAPAVPHALHMPSHTFTRMGMWQESVATNTRSADTAERGGEPAAVLHALDYMAYAYLQMGMDSQAHAVLERANRLVAPAKDGQPVALANGFAIAAIPARYALERQQWAEAAKVKVVPFPTASPYVEAMSRFTRAIGAARAGDLAAVPAEIDRLAALREQQLALKDEYWAQIIDIERRGAQAWLLFAQGKTDEAVQLMRAAADAEDATDKSAVTPGPLAPAREMLGFMLLQAGKVDESLSAFDTAIAKEPNRFLALYGAGQAAEKANQRQRAKRYYHQLVAICKDASSDRPELIHARAMAR